MRVISFVGESGTGKSYRATKLANKKNIECIIDDGLLIKGAVILGGTSAKREPTRIGSIKKALFTREEDAKKAAEAKKRAEVPRSAVGRCARLHRGGLTAAGGRQVAEAKSLHDKLEDCYRQAMDYGRVEDIRAGLLDRLLALAEE